MIHRETRQCPKVDSRPVGVQEGCRKCEWYDPDPGTMWHCRYIIYNVDHNKYIEKVREILEGDAG